MGKTDSSPVVREALEEYNLTNDSVMRISAQFMSLTPLQQLVLKAIADNMLSDDHVTDAQIAINLGIARDTVLNARKNPAFGECLTVITRDIIRSQTDKTLLNIQKHSAKDWKAGEFLLKYTGDYIPRSQSQNLNVNLSQSTVNRATTPTEMLDSILIQLIGLGVSADRVKERMLELQREGI